jgi:hypothetical protein
MRSRYLNDKLFEVINDQTPTYRAFMERKLVIRETEYVSFTSYYSLSLT